VYVATDQSAETLFASGSNRVQEGRGFKLTSARQLRVWIVDGASSDSSSTAALEAVAGDPRFTPLRETVADKTAQSNTALRQSDSHWIMITNADARTM
jgi:hypothetical protein